MKQNIIKVNIGSEYTRRDGTSQASENEKQFKAQHPNAEEYFGDLRSEKTLFSAVYRLYSYEHHSRYASRYPRVYATYIER